MDEETRMAEVAAMKAAFKAHRGGAKQRGISFEFSLEDWCAWWLEDGRWQRKQAERLCMARNGDVGPYARGNVYCTTTSQNTKDHWKFNPPALDKKSTIFRVPKGTRARIATQQQPGELLADTQRRVVLAGLAALEAEPDQPSGE